MGLGLIGTAVLFLSIRWFFDVPPEWMLRMKALRSTPLEAPEGMKEADYVPSAKGSLAGSNVLLITLDTTRADRLHCYGNKSIETPHLDRLATGGVLFSAAISPASTTLPSHGSILTGLYPYHHGARANGFTRLSDDQTTLAEVLSQQGYQTGAFISAYVVDSRFGLGQGFSFYDDYLEVTSESIAQLMPERLGSVTTDRAIEWLRKTGDKKFFAWVHLFDPHQPYTPPPEFAEKYKGFLYDGEIAFADSQIGRLLKVLEERGVLDQTMVVVIGDHGQGMLQHMELTHGFFVYNSTVRVPLIMSCGQKLGGGVHIRRAVSAVDVMPTLLSLLGVDASLKFDGEDLTQPPSTAPRAIFSDTLEGLNECAVAPQMAVLEGPMKYIYGPDPELYDVSVDPDEEKNIITEHADVAERLKGLLAAFYDNDLAKGGYLATTEQLTSEEIQQLQALGYAGGGGGPLVPGAGSLPDPKKVMPLIMRVDSSYDVYEREGPQAAAKYLEKIIEDAPDFYMALRTLATFLVQTKDFEKARQVLERCLQIHPDIPFPLVPLGRIYAHAGEYEKSIDSLEKALKACPDDYGALTWLGRLYLSRGQPQKAVQYLLRAAMVRPSDQSVAEQLASAMSQAGRADEAIGIFKDRLSKNPNLGFVRNALASLLMEQGKCAEVIPLMREGLKRHPDHLSLVNNLAFAMILCKRPDDPVIEAVVMMEQACRASDYQVPEYLRTLGLAYGELFRLDEAIGVSEKALKLAEDMKLPSLIQQLQRNLQGFREMRAKGISPMIRIGEGITTTQPAATTMPVLDTAQHKP